MFFCFGFCVVPASTTWLLFCSYINKIALVLFPHQQNMFCFSPISTTAGKTSRGCVNLHTPDSQVSTKAETDFTDKARQWSDLGSIKDYSLYSGPPLQVELQSSGGNGVGEYHGSKLGLYEMMPADVKSGGQRVYRQLHHDIKGKDIKQSYLYRWLTWKLE